MLTSKQFFTEFAKAHKGLPCHPDVQIAYDNSDASLNYIQRQAKAWKAYKG